jgi:hypothetical protein
MVKFAKKVHEVLLLKHLHTNLNLRLKLLVGFAVMFILYQMFQTDW